MPKQNPAAIAEITFDRDARHEYLTGFHKRKLARQKAAQQAAEKREKEERAEERRQLRARRKEELSEALEIAGAGQVADGEGQDSGKEEAVAVVGEVVDKEEMYVDEDRFTTVTVEAMEEEEGEEEAGERKWEEKEGEDRPKKKKPKEKKKKFRYLSKAERKVDRVKLKQRKQKEREKFRKEKREKPKPKKGR